MKRLLVLSILLLAAHPAFAKCGGKYHVFSGVVTDKAGKPIPGATVGIAWTEMRGPAGPALALTDGEGRYRIPVVFETYSGKGKVVEDECKFRVDVVSLSSSKGSLQSNYDLVRIGDAENIRLPSSVIWFERPDGTMQRLLKGPKR